MRLVNRDVIVELRGKLDAVGTEVKAWREHGEQLEAELDNLLTVNEMSQDNIKLCEAALDRKDLVIEDQAAMIGKLAQGSVEDLRELETRFFTN